MLAHGEADIVIWFNGLPASHQMLMHDGKDVYFWAVIIQKHRSQIDCPTLGVARNSSGDQGQSLALRNLLGMAPPPQKNYVLQFPGCADVCMADFFDVKHRISVLRVQSLRAFQARELEK